MKKILILLTFVFLLMLHINLSAQNTRFEDNDIIRIWIQGSITFFKTHPEEGSKVKVTEHYHSSTGRIYAKQYDDLDKEKTIEEWIKGFFKHKNMIGKYEDYQIASLSDILSYDLVIEFSRPEELRNRLDEMHNPKGRSSYSFEPIVGSDHSKWELWYKSGNYGPNANYSEKHPGFEKPNPYRGMTKLILLTILGIAAGVTAGLIAAGII